MKLFLPLLKFDASYLYLCTPYFLLDVKVDTHKMAVNGIFFKSKTILLPPPEKKLYPLHIPPPFAFILYCFTHSPFFFHSSCFFNQWHCRIFSQKGYILYIYIIGCQLHHVTQRINKYYLYYYYYCCCVYTYGGKETATLTLTCANFLFNCKRFG